MYIRIYNYTYTYIRISGLVFFCVCMCLPLRFSLCVCLCYIYVYILYIYTCIYIYLSTLSVSKRVLSCLCLSSSARTTACGDVRNIRMCRRFIWEPPIAPYGCTYVYIVSVILDVLPVYSLSFSPGQETADKQQMDNQIADFMKVYKIYTCI